MTRLSLLVGCFALLMSGCHLLFEPAIQGSGNRTVEDRQVGTFEQLEVNAPGEFTIILGEEASVVSIDIDDNLQPVIQTSLQGDTLVIKSLHNFASPDGLKGTIHADHMESIEINGSGDIQVVGLSGERCNLTISGSGDIVANGSTEELRVTISGSGSVDLREVQAERVGITISGSGSAIVHATESLKVSIAGSGDVEYLGSPSIQQSISGSGDIAPLIQ